MMRIKRLALTGMIASTLTACQAADRGHSLFATLPGGNAQATATGPVVDLGARTGATISVTIRMKPGLSTQAAPPTPAGFRFELRDAGTNAVVGVQGGFISTATFSNVPAGTYYCQVDARNALNNSITLGGPQNSTNQVTVTGNTATYTTGFSLTTSLTILPGTGGTVPVSIGNPYAGAYGELVNATTGALISQYDSASPNFNLLQVTDGTFAFWGMGRVGGYATMARRATNVTVSGSGGSVSGSWNLAITNQISSLAGGGVSALADGLAATSVLLPAVRDVAYDAAGNLLAVAGNRVIMVPRNNGNFYGIAMTANQIYTVAGAAGAGNSGDGGPATAALLNAPAGLTVGAGGTIYVADTLNHSVRTISAGGTISLFAGSGAPGYTGDAGTATTATLNTPYDVAVDGANVRIADNGNNVIRTVAGATIQTAAIPGISSPRSLLRDASGNLVIANAGANNVLVVAPAAGTFYGQAMAANSTNALALAVSPIAVAADAGGHLYIGEAFGRVTIRALNGTLFTIVNGGGSGGDGGSAAGAGITNASGIAMDPITGGMAIADQGNARVRYVF